MARVQMSAAEIQTSQDTFARHPAPWTFSPVARENQPDAYNVFDAAGNFVFVAQYERVACALVRAVNDRHLLLLILGTMADYTTERYRAVQEGKSLP